MTKLWLWTAQMMYKNQCNLRRQGNADIGYVDDIGRIVLDTTIGSGFGLGATFAPTWDLVMGHKNGRISWKTYTEGYYALMRQRYAEHRDLFIEACKSEKLVLLCYCSAGKATCHRHLLIDILRKVSRREGIQAHSFGELSF